MVKNEYTKTTLDYDREDARERVKREVEEAILSGRALRRMLEGKRILESVH
jgi:hypothetical protein